MLVLSFSYRWVLLIVLLSVGCSESEPMSEQVSTDISVSAITPTIIWEDQEDLDAQLEDAFAFNTGLALESEVVKTLSVASDSTGATATIDFKLGLQDKYTDINDFNNAATIDLEKSQDSGGSGTLLKADGPGNTYALIASVLAPGSNPIEAPDCSHPGFGDHIDEVMDNELGRPVFRFHIHTEEDDDRCINFDRQRNEIKSYDKSPDNLLGVENETVVYSWKFKLPAGFQSSPNFTHIHQLKSVGGSLESMPIYTLTTRKGNPDQMELRYAETDTQVTLAKTALSPLVDTWVEVTETITYGMAGTYDISIKRISDEVVLFSYATDSIINWRPGGTFVRPKWGIYRSLINAQDLRDETLLYADFRVEEL